MNDDFRDPFSIEREISFEYLSLYDTFMINILLCNPCQNLFYNLRMLPYTKVGI